MKLNKDTKKETSSSLSPKFFPQIQIGLVINVSKENLKELINLNKEKNFLENFFSEFKGEIITLINGNEDIPYLDINELLVSLIEFLGKNSGKKAFNNEKKGNSFDEISLLKIFEEIKNNLGMSKIKNSKEVYENILKLKKIILDSYKLFISTFIENLYNSISKPSSILIPLKNIMKVLSKYNEDKYIIIISDTSSNEKLENVKDLLIQAEKMNITIATIFLSKSKKIKKQFYNEFPKHLNQNIINLFNISSEVNYKNPFAHYFIKKDYRFPSKGKARLLLEANFEEVINTNALANNLNNINVIRMDIKIGDINYNSFLQFNYKFMAKNQIFGTCWANACAGSMFLTNKRILGKNIDSFQTNRENIIKILSDKYDDGGFLDDRKIANYFEEKRIHIKEVNKEEAKIAIMKGRFIVCSFYLNDKQWENFSNFYKQNENPKGILNKNQIDNGCENEKEKTDLGGHAVILIEVGENYLRFLNSWGAGWADAGTFKIEDFNVLTPYNKNKNRINHKYAFRCFDVFYYEEELTEKEKDYYYNNIDFIREILSRFNNSSFERIKDRINSLNEQRHYCESCNSLIALHEYKTNIENGLYKISCPNCNFIKQAEGESREFLIWKDLMHDGNDDFDINFQENEYIKIKRGDLHHKYQQYIKNASDTCSIGREIGDKIESYFNEKINKIIHLKNRKFAVCYGNRISVIKLSKQRMETETESWDEIKVEFLKQIKMPGENLVTLCDLKIRDSNIIACGGEYLTILNLNNETEKSIFIKRLKDNKKINKIILLDERTGQNLKRLIVCDKNGDIGLYNINNTERNIDVSFVFKKNCHDNEINCILYLPEEQMLVSGSKLDKNIKFFEIRENDLVLTDCLNDIPSTMHNGSLLNINGNLLIGEKNGIRVVHHENRRIISSYFFNNEEFGGVYIMKYLGNNYFICGRSFGFCSLFLLSENSIRKINIFRNNNLVNYNNICNDRVDNYYITDICIRKITGQSYGYILISSADRTLKVYSYEFHNMPINLNNDNN